MPLPWMHLRPASITSHFELSSISGTLADVRLAEPMRLQEAHHGRLRIEHRLVHVDVDDLRAVLHLLPRHGQRIVVAAFEDHAGEGFGAGDVGALANVDEQAVVGDVEGLRGPTRRREKSALARRGLVFCSASAIARM
jgi:hypothetical protein